MKKCTWCGKEYPDTAERCVIDAEPLEPVESPAGVPARQGDTRTQNHNALPDALVSVLPAHVQLVPPDWQPRLIHLAQFQGAVNFKDGYARPDWKLIRTLIERNIPPEETGEAWTEAAIQWIQELRSDLGANYAVWRSGEFLLLTSLAPVAAAELLSFAEITRANIYTTLGDAAWRTAAGKHVILLFQEDDDYYQYVSYFDDEGLHPTSGGCLIHRGYVHIAMPLLDGRHIRRTLTHELVHNSLVHMRLPLWLNEGLAVSFDRGVADWRSPILDRELQEQHLGFWNETSIQKFWAGTSFHEPGDSNKLSYSLAEIMIQLLAEHGQELGGFVKNAAWIDAGQTAAVEILNADLGDIVGTFLGEGNWQPNRKAMVQCWEAAKHPAQPAQP